MVPKFKLKQIVEFNNPQEQNWGIGMIMSITSQLNADGVKYYTYDIRHRSGFKNANSSTRIDETFITKIYVEEK